MILDVCVSPVLYPYYQQDDDTVVVVDIFRASTTICYMLANGAQCVVPVADIEEARRYKEQGFLTGAERNAVKCDFADFGNSPLDYKPSIVSGRKVVFSTSNGTQAINIAKRCRTLFIGAFVNIDKVIEKCLSASGRTVIVCSGWKNRINYEDTYFAGAFAEKLSEMGELQSGSDAVTMAMSLWAMAKDNLMESIKKIEHYSRLVKNNAAGDIPYCLDFNSLSVVPRLNKANGELTDD